MLWAVGRFAGSIVFFDSDPGACAPGFMLPPASRAQTFFILVSWGLRPRIKIKKAIEPAKWATARYALGCRPLRGLNRDFDSDPGACAPGFMLPSASRTSRPQPTVADGADGATVRTRDR